KRDPLGTRPQRAPGPPAPNRRSRRTGPPLSRGPDGEDRLGAPATPPPPMAYFLGVDGGATSTACAISDADGRILGVGHGGPSNHILAPGGEARAREAVDASLGAAAAAAGLDRVEFVAAH